MTEWADIVSWVLIVLGGTFSIVGALGLIRFPDFYSRLHAGGITDTLGAWLLIAGMMFQAGLSQVTIKLALIVVFLFFTSPTSTHALGRAALHAGIKPWTKPRRNTAETPPAPVAAEESAAMKAEG
ncbi:MAG: monovalent cation/H(+) antiporter subunit G [Candidatus Krumholzibacteria bacterium]